MEFVASRKPFHLEGGAGGQVGRDYEIIGDPRPGNNMSSSSTSGTSGSTRVEWPLFPTPTISLLQVSGYEIYNGTPVSLIKQSFSLFIILSHSITV